jgi:hypothetical protein
VYATRNRLAAGVGSDAVTAVFGKPINRLADRIESLEHELHALRTGHHIGNTNIHRQTVIESSKARKAKAASHKSRRGR